MFFILKYLLMFFVFIHAYLSSPFLRIMCTDVKACNEIQFFTPEYMRACGALHNMRFLQSQTKND